MDDKMAFNRECFSWIVQNYGGFCWIVQNEAMIVAWKQYEKKQSSVAVSCPTVCNLPHSGTVLPQIFLVRPQLVCAQNFFF